MTWYRNLGCPWLRQFHKQLALLPTLHPTSYCVVAEPLNPVDQRMRFQEAAKLLLQQCSHARTVAEWYHSIVARGSLALV
jgi:hypothetical protein